MSARSRQDTIARFSVPITEEDAATRSAPRAPQPTTSTGRPSRRKTRSSRMVIDVDADGAGDADFVAGDDGDDSDFLDDDEEERPSKKRRVKKKAAGKASVEDDFPFPLNGTTFGKQNPRVMLISLKAGALGLNLTVANNVFL